MIGLGIGVLVGAIIGAFLGPTIFERLYRLWLWIGGDG